MANGIKGKSFVDADETRLAEIIRNTWGYEKLSKSPEVALLMGRIYLYSCLCSQNYNLVATRDGCPVGIIMGNSRNKQQEISSAWKERLAYLLQQMCQYEEGKFILELFSGFEQIDGELLEATGQAYDGELVFFVTDSAVRGQQVGKRLYDCFLQEMRQNNCQRIYVYTDATCNFGFMSTKDSAGWDAGSMRFMAMPLSSTFMKRRFSLEVHGTTILEVCFA